MNNEGNIECIVEQISDSYTNIYSLLKSTVILTRNTLSTYLETTWLVFMLLLRLQGGFCHKGIASLLASHCWTYRTRNVMDGYGTWHFVDDRICS